MSVNSRVIVTSGAPYVDIDAFAGCIAYAELLKLQGRDAIAYSSSKINESVPVDLRSLSSDFQTSYVARPEDVYVIIDTSDPDVFDRAVVLNRVTEVIDHHTGFEDFWAEKLGEKSRIEFVGAACTQVYELWKRSEYPEQMSEASARLLSAGILDNTLNFGANITTARDKEAYSNLAKIAKLGPDWPKYYFGLCQQSIVSDIAGAIGSDTKVIKFSGISDNVYFGQTTIWDSELVLEYDNAYFAGVFASEGQHWLVNVISLKSACSYFIASDDLIEKYFSSLLNIKFSEGRAQADRLWLRKEIIKTDQEKSS